MARPAAARGDPARRARTRAGRRHGRPRPGRIRRSSRIHTVKILRLSEDLPMVIEIVDQPEKIQAFLPTIDQMVTEGMVTLEKVNVLIYRHNASQK